MKKNTNKGLGKGLTALLPSISSEGALSEFDVGVKEINITNIRPNSSQPRQHFDHVLIEELATSIKEFGIIQPIVVTLNNDDTYTIVAGERRWRAAVAVGLETIPVIVRNYTYTETIEIALIENIQRENLNPIEEANCYKRLNEEFKFTHEAISAKVGKSRSHITNIMRLLKLDQRVQNYVLSGELSVGHAKAILQLEDGEAQYYCSKKVIEDGMNVREIEEFIKRAYEINKEKSSENKPKDNKNKAKYAELQAQLRNILSTRVNIKDNKNGSSGGKIEINFFSEDDLSRIISIFEKQ